MKFKKKSSVIVRNEKLNNQISQIKDMISGLRNVARETSDALRITEARFEKEKALLVKRIQDSNDEIKNWETILEKVNASS